MANKKYDTILTEDYLRQEYHENGKTLSEIARKVKCDWKTVEGYFDYFQLARRSNGKKMSNHGKWRGFGELSLTQFNNIRHNAKIRSIEFSLTIEDLWHLYLKQNGECTLSGRKIGFVHSKRGNASLDRIVSNRPYEKGNVWWVHRDVNLAKQSLSVEDFITLCRNVVSKNTV